MQVSEMTFEFNASAYQAKVNQGITSGKEVRAKRESEESLAFRKSMDELYRRVDERTQSILDQLPRLIKEAIAKTPGYKTTAIVTVMKLDSDEYCGTFTPGWGIFGMRKPRVKYLLRTASRVFTHLQIADLQPQLVCVDDDEIKLEIQLHIKL